MWREESENQKKRTRCQAAEPFTSLRNDAGPWLECVVWHDGEHWRAAVDSSDMYAPDDGRGLLADFTPLTDFKTERQYATFRCAESEMLSKKVDQGMNVDFISLWTVPGCWQISRH